MSAFAYPAKFTTGGDGRILVEFVDFPRVATDGKDNVAGEADIAWFAYDLVRDPADHRFQSQRLTKNPQGSFNHHILKQI